MTNKSKDWKKTREKIEMENNTLEVNDLDDLTDSEDSVENSHDALEHPSYQILEEKLTLAEQLAHENWEKLVRATAEVENVSNRAKREVSNAHRYGLEKFANAIIPIGDSLEQSLQIAVKNSDVSMQEGLELTMKLFLDVLGKFDVHQLDPQGQLFDPQQHEAMAMQDSAEVPPNHVLAVFQKGYKLHDRIIRPARVVVSKEKKA